MATSSDAAAAGTAGPEAARDATDAAPGAASPSPVTAAADSAKPEKTLIFLHVPKAAGTTMASILTAQYGKSTSLHTKRQAHQQIKAMSKEQRRQLRLIHGHMPFGIHRHLSQPWTYFTMLRHPVDRVISHYYYILNSPDHVGHAIAKAARNLGDYVNCGLVAQTNNVQTRHISGIGGKVEFGQCTPQHLQQAKRNLEQVFVLAGTSEQFDATLLLLGQRLGWTPSPYPKLNVNPRRQQREDLPKKIIATIERHNTLDLELYHHVRQQLQQQIEAQGPDFQAALAAFQQANLRYGAAQSVARSAAQNTAQSAAQNKPPSRVKDLSPSNPTPQNIGGQPATGGISSQAESQGPADASRALQQLQAQLTEAQKEIQALEALQNRTQKHLRRAIIRLAQLHRNSQSPPGHRSAQNPQTWRQRISPLVARLQTLRPNDSR